MTTERLKTYILQRIPPMLQRELNRYLLYRTETFAARRAGGAVQSVSAEADNTALLRFFGWQAATASRAGGRLARVHAAP